MPSRISPLIWGNASSTTALTAKSRAAPVTEALRRGDIEPTRYESYEKLFDLAAARKPWEQK